MITIEKWKPIKGYEGKYEVSNKGMVRSLDWVVPNRFSLRLVKGRILKPTISSSGYYYINLSIDGVSKSFDIHRIEALTFYGYENEHLTVNHDDGNKLNNDLDNLKFMTQAQNNEHKTKVLRKGLGRNMSGKNNPMFGRKHSQSTKYKISLRKLST